MQSVSPGSAYTGVTSAQLDAEHAARSAEPPSKEQAVGMFIGGLAILVVIVFGVIKFKQWRES
jgi:hypothetical protein